MFNRQNEYGSSGFILYVMLVTNKKTEAMNRTPTCHVGGYEHAGKRHRGNNKLRYLLYNITISAPFNTGGYIFYVVRICIIFTYERKNDMRTVALLAVTFILIIISIANNISVAYPMLCGLIIIGADAVARGYKFRDVASMAVNGIKKSLIIYKVFVLIGSIISIWIASGTVPGLMYYGFKMINPEFYIVISFLLTSLVSMLLGTSFGTISTIGIALMAVGRGFDINLSILSGAIISGAYLGDRSSPMSSSAVLTAAVTESDLYENLKYMISTLIPAFIISLILYILSGSSHISASYDFSRVSSIQNSIGHNFNINPIVLIPPVIIMLLALFKIDIKTNMLIGIIAGSIIALFMQHVSFIELIKYAVLGYSNNFSDSFLSSIIKGGGIISMVKAAVIIAVSSGLNGILEGTKMLDNILKGFTDSIKTKEQLVLKTAVIGIITAMYGCSQTISIMMTGYIMKPQYRKLNMSNKSMARVIADTCVVLSPMIPWNIAGMVPALNMGVKSIDFIPYSYLCFLLPVITISYAYAARCKAAFGKR